MTILVAGASGATGRLLVEQLLGRGQRVRVIVRPGARPPVEPGDHDGLSVVEASILDIGDGELARLVGDCDAIASCLGHNLSFRGIFGPPRRLVTDATRRLCEAVKSRQPATPARFVLMNTTGNRNRDLAEATPRAQQFVVWLLRKLVPPHADNEEAADYLRVDIGQNDAHVEWSVVRPDSLIDESAVTPYEVHPSPTRSAIFDAGKSSRINVAHFITELLTNDQTWSRWKGSMPVLYNTSAA